MICGWWSLRPRPRITSGRRSGWNSHSLSTRWSSWSRLRSMLPGCCGSRRLRLIHATKRGEGSLLTLRHTLATTARDFSRTRGTLGALPPRGRHERAWTAVISVLAQVDPLPGAQREAAIAQRQGQRRAQQGGLQVRRHVVIALERVGPVGRSLRHRLVEPRAK